MGLFDKLKNNKKDTEIIQDKEQQEEKIITSETPEEPEFTEEENGLFKEKFFGTEKPNQDEVNAICNTFVAKGIIAYANNTLETDELSKLSYDQLCHVYNNIEAYTEKLAPFLKKDAINYKQYLRKQLLEKLLKMTLYTIHAKPSNLPFMIQNSSMFIYTDKTVAEESMKNSVYKWIEVHEIEPETFNANFCEYYCTGYQNVIINGNTIIKIEDLYKVQDEKSYGNICKKACNSMIEFKQAHAMILDKAKSENRKLEENEIKTINMRSWSASVELLACKLLLPAQMENNTPGKVTIPLAVMNNGAKFIAFFTDQGAINRYFKKFVPCVGISNLIKDQYANIKKDENISGIVINPARECYVITKEMLSQLLRDHE